MSSKSKGDAPKAGKDIRGFFASSQPKSSTQPASTESSKPSRPSRPIEISDGEDRASPAPSKVARKMTGMKLGSDTDMKSEKSVRSTGSRSKTNGTKSTNGTRKRKKGVVDSSDEEEEEFVPRKKAAVESNSSSKPKAIAKSASSKASVMTVSSSEDSSSDEPPRRAPPKKPTIASKPKPKPKPKVIDLSDEEPPKKASTSKATAKPKPQPKKVKEEPKEGESKAAKVNYNAVLARRAAGPIAPGSKEIPVGEPNCLSGLTFVFTGELDSLSRDEAADLAKRYGGRITTAPSRKTSYVVLGTGAGPKKLEVIKSQGLKTLNEDGFLDLIRGREAVLDEKTLEKMRKEEEKVKKEAEEMEKRERQEAKASKKKNEKFNADPTSQLWTTKYAPKALKDICGNKSNVEKVQSWLHDWQASRKSGFRNGGKHAIGIYRALLIYGPPGVGKTSAAHLVAKLEGYTPIELNASDVRSKKLIENATNVNNASLDGWMSGKGISTDGVAITDKTVLIMDEIDGMSAGDRGGVVALKALIKKTHVPIICIANDIQSQKLKPLQGFTGQIHFTRPPAAQVKSRIATICYKEKMNMDPNVIEELINGSQSDIRQVLNMLSTWKLSKGSMDFEESKQLTSDNQKYAIMTPFNVTQKVLGPYLFAKTARETLNEKMEFYFHEPSLMPLFIQENYLKANPSKVAQLPEGPDKVMKTLELMGKASQSISDADLVDSMLRGSEQHWSLMPLHACLSLVRPASHMYGSSVGSSFQYKEMSSFPQWLGQNSKQGKLQRALGDVQAKMRMKVSGDKAEIRQLYIPALTPHLVEPLAGKGKPKDDAIKEVINVMDEYYLEKDDWDTLVDLGVGDRGGDTVLKTIPPATKAAFTKAYNASGHPVAFHKGQDLGAPIKKIAAREMPDVEEAFDVEDEILPDDDEEEVKPKAKNKGINDSLVKEKKPKAAAGAGKAEKKDIGK